MLNRKEEGFHEYVRIVYYIDENGKRVFPRGVNGEYLYAYLGRKYWIGHVESRKIEFVYTGGFKFLDNGRYAPQDSSGAFIKPKKYILDRLIDDDPKAPAQFSNTSTYTGTDRFELCYHEGTANQKIWIKNMQGAYLYRYKTMYVWVLKGSNEIRPAKPTNELDAALIKSLGDKTRVPEDSMGAFIPASHISVDPLLLSSYHAQAEELGNDAYTN